MNLRRIFAAAVVGLALVAQATLPAPAEPSGSMVDLGVPMREPNVRFTTTGSDGDGRGLVFALSDGHPATFYAVDAMTGDVLFEWTNNDPSDEYLGGDMYGYDGGALFIMRTGGQSSLYRYDVASASVELVVRGCNSGECTIPSGVFRGVTADADGVIHIATYPQSKVFSFDPATGAVQDHGPTATVGDYAWGLDIVGRELFVGTGTGAAELWRIDLDSGTKSQIPLPDGASDTTVIGEVQTVGQHIMVPLNSGPPRMGVYDTVADSWSCMPDLPGVPTPTDAFSEPTADGRTFFRVGDEIYELAVETCEVRAVGYQGPVDKLRAVVLATSGTTDNPTYTLGAISRDGDFLQVDPATGSATVLATEIRGAPITTHSLGVGPDGNVYIGAFLSPGTMARIDPATNTIEQLDGPEQADTIASVAGNLVVGSYPNAVVHSGDPTQPWVWGENPRNLFNLASDNQDRIFTLIDADGTGALGTVSKYGSLGGALALFDPETGSREVYKPATDQSVVGLTYRDGVIWGGTSIHNALSTEPTTTEGQIFGFDLATREVIHRSVPVPGAETVSDLEFGASGNELWGMTYDNTLFAFDTRTNTVTRSMDVDLPSYGANWGRVPEIEFRQQDGLLYGVAGESLFSFDPATEEISILADDHPYKTLAMTEDGRIYVIDGTNVHEWVIEDEEPVTYESAVATVEQYYQDGLLERPHDRQLHNHLETAQRLAGRGLAVPAGEALDRVARVAEKVTDEEVREHLLSIAESLRGQL